MRVKGSSAPKTPFTVEQQPKNPKLALVRFFENVEPFNEERDGMESTGYIYDEYHLELQFYPALEDDIRANHDVYLTQAKLAEAEKQTIPVLIQQVAQDRALIDYLGMMGGIELPNQS